MSSNTSSQDVSSLGENISPSEKLFSSSDDTAIGTLR